MNVVCFEWSMNSSATNRFVFNGHHDFFFLLTSLQLLILARIFKML